MSLNLKAREFYFYRIKVCEFNVLLSVRGYKNIAVRAIY
jgi:hypothetical protein